MSLPSINNDPDVALDAGGEIELSEFRIPINDSLSNYAAGTPYTLTASEALVDFGTTDPILKLSGVEGFWSVRARISVKLSGATFSSNKILTVKLKNADGDIANSETSYTIPITTTLTQTLGVIELPEVIYRSSAPSGLNPGDEIKIYAGLESLPSAGSVQITEASIVAIFLRPVPEVITFTNFEDAAGVQTIDFDKALLHTYTLDSARHLWFEYPFIAPVSGTNDWIARFRLKKQIGAGITQVANTMRVFAPDFTGTVNVNMGIAIETGGYGGTTVAQSSIGFSFQNPPADPNDPPPTSPIPYDIAGDILNFSAETDLFVSFQLEISVSVGFTGTFRIQPIFDVTPV
jgi:hypothetical protein